MVWSSSRYNNYLNFGTKKENVDYAYNSLKAGHYVGWRGKEDKEKTVFTLECAQGVGENGLGRSWRTKGGSDDYIVDCVNKTVTKKYRKEVIGFL